MFKLVAVLVFVIVNLTDCQDKIQQFIDDSNNIKTVEGLKCSRLEGSSSECLACYNCDHERVKSLNNVQKLTFSYSNCTKDELCCVQARTLKARTNDENCGKNNPNGDPRVSRPSLRAVLQREYPWRAWVYSFSGNNNAPLCAASYINFGVKGLLTTASCVSGFQPSDLYVKFTKTQQNPDRVKDVVLHENFMKIRTSGNLDDIALLTLAQKPDNLVKSVCLDSKPTLLGSSCVVVSDSETSINTIVPQLAKCKSNNVNIENKVMCTFMVAGDYIPQSGAGLYCLNEHSAAAQYTIQGIYQSYQNDGPVALYTNVYNYTNWILRTTNRMRNNLSN